VVQAGRLRHNKDNEGGSMTLHRFVVPVKGVNTFCTFLNGQLRPENPLPLVGTGEQAIDDEFGWVAWADGGKTIGLTHLDAIEGEGGFSPLVMPEKYEAGCLLFHRQVLFVGGRCGTEVIGAFDCANPEPRWTPLDVPAEFRKYGKQIDDLLLDNDRLIAVDNHDVPKYLLVYSVADPRQPRLLETRRIPTLWWGESIYAGALGTNWLALLSIGGGSFVGSRMQIGLYDRRALALFGWLAAIPKQRAYGFGGLAKGPRRTWNRIAFAGDVLLIAADDDGVGVLELAKLQRPANPVECDPDNRGHFERSAFKSEHEEFSKACEAALRYVRPAGRLGEVVQVIPVPDSRHFLAIVESETELDTVVMELP
jgi:hypothetical protein